MPEPCGSNDCTETAEYEVFWPGRAPLKMCQACRTRAHRVADAMGFYLYSTLMPITPEKKDPAGGKSRSLK